MTYIGPTDSSVDDVADALVDKLNYGEVIRMKDNSGSVLLVGPERSKQAEFLIWEEVL